MKRRYDITADIYDRRYLDEQEAKYRVALNGVTLHGLVLDIGCGTGLFLRHVSPSTANVLGIDLSRKLLHRAKEHAKTLCNVDLVQADADNLPFNDRDFDAIFAFTVLQNMPEPLATLKEIRRIAKDEATVVVTGLKKVFALQTLKKLLEEARFLVVSVENHDNLVCHIMRARKAPD